MSEYIVNHIIKAAWNTQLYQVRKGDLLCGTMHPISPGPYSSF